MLILQVLNATYRIINLKYTESKNSESYHIQYTGAGSVFAPGRPADPEPGGVAHGGPAAADPQICPGGRPAYLKLGFALHPADGFCTQSPDTLAGKDSHIPLAFQRLFPVAGRHPRRTVPIRPSG